MAHFIGKVHGGHGEASHLGHAKEGLTTTAASYSGAVNVKLYVKDGVDYACVALIPWEGKGVSRVMYDGPVSGYQQ